MSAGKRRVRRGSLERAALRIAGILGDDGVLVGGLAVAAWGYVRATDDVDFVAGIGPGAAAERLAASGIETTLHRGNVRDGDIAWCVKGTVDGVVFDVLPPVVPLELDRAVTVPLARGKAVRVVDLDGLLRLKLRAGGPQDLLDVAQLLRRHPGLVERVRPIAEAYAVWDRVFNWMNDPRVR